MRTHRTLVTRERNAVLDEIERLGLDPTLFDWDERFVRTQMVESVEHPATGSYFAIGVGQDGTYYFGEFEPGIEAQVTGVGGLTWPQTIVNLREWLRRVVSDAAEPDRWAQIAGAREQLTAALGVGASLDMPLLVWRDREPGRTAPG